MLVLLRAIVELSIVIVFKVAASIPNVFPWEVTIVRFYECFGRR
jgi:hypothetical protein